MALSIKKYNSTDFVEFANSTELVDFLKTCNPLVLRYYKKELSVKKRDIQVKGIGTNIKLLKRI